MEDIRGVMRLHCKVCGIDECGAYLRPMIGNNCDYCGCAPVKHEKGQSIPEIHNIICNVNPCIVKYEDFSVNPLTGLPGNSEEIPETKPQLPLFLPGQSAGGCHSATMLPTENSLEVCDKKPCLAVVASVQSTGVKSCSADSMSMLSEDESERCSTSPALVSVFKQLTSIKVKTSSDVQTVQSTSMEDGVDVPVSTLRPRKGVKTSTDVQDWLTVESTSMEDGGVVPVSIPRPRKGVCPSNRPGLNPPKTVFQFLPSNTVKSLKAVLTKAAVAGRAYRAKMKKDPERYARYLARSRARSIANRIRREAKKEQDGKTFRKWLMKVDSKISTVKRKNIPKHLPCLPQSPTELPCLYWWEKKQEELKERKFQAMPCEKRNLKYNLQTQNYLDQYQIKSCHCVITKIIMPEEKDAMESPNFHKVVHITESPKSLPEEESALNFTE